jgi:hypothetical protein
VVQYFVGAGFYVIPTYSPSDFSVDNSVASTPAVFLRNWANLWTAITEVHSRPSVPACFPWLPAPAEGFEVLETGAQCCWLLCWLVGHSVAPMHV